VQTIVADAVKKGIKVDAAGVAFTLGYAAALKRSHSKPVAASNAESAKPHLIYFHCTGARAEPIRYVLRFAKVDFKNEMFTLEDFADPKSDYHTRKNAGEFGTFAESGGGLPVYIENGKKYFETNAILRMLGARYGFYSTDPDTMWEIDICMESAEQIFNHAGVGQHSRYCFAMMGKDEPTKEQTETCFEMYKKFINFAQSQLVKHGTKFLAGTDRPTIADFRYIIQFNDGPYNPKTALGPAMAKRVRELIDTCPDLKKWIEETMFEVLKDVRTPGIQW